MWIRQLRHSLYLTPHLQSYCPCKICVDSLIIALNDGELDSWFCLEIRSLTQQARMRRCSKWRVFWRIQDDKCIYMFNYTTLFNATLIQDEFFCKIKRALSSVPVFYDSNDCDIPLRFYGNFIWVKQNRKAEKQQRNQGLLSLEGILVFSA